MEISNKGSEPAYAIALAPWLSHYCFKIIRSLPVFLLLATALIFFAMDFPLFYQTFINANLSFLKNSTLAWYDLYSAFLYFFIPALCTRYIFKDKLAAVGLVMPARPGRAIICILLAIAVLIPYMIMFAQQGNFRHFYSVHDSSLAKLFFVIMVIYPPYYFVEEFFFRGFLFIYLWKKVGWHSFWITDIFFTLSHLGKPGLEILLCIPASVVLNCLTLATRSLYPAAIVHFTLGTVFFLLVNLPA